MAAALLREGKNAAVNLAQHVLRPTAEKIPTLVFLGPPGVGKGTYSARIAQQLNLAHISVGELVRSEIHSHTVLGNAAAAAVAKGDLLSDELIFQLLSKRMIAGEQQGKETFLLDGFPRTAAQAETLLENTDVRLAVNMHLREDVLLQKCLGRRICSKCGANYNIAEINYPATPTLPSVVMPALPPKLSCKDSLITRADDNEQTFNHRMEVYKQEAAPVELLFKKAGLLLDFHITGGIPETMPNLIAALRPYNFAARRAQQQLKQVA